MGSGLDPTHTETPVLNQADGDLAEEKEEGEERGRRRKKKKKVKRKKKRPQMYCRSWIHDWQYGGAAIFPLVATRD